MYVHVNSARHDAKLRRNLSGDTEIRVRLRQRPADLDVDRRRQAEVEDLVDDVGRLCEEPELRKPLRQLVAKRLEVRRGRAMRRVERDHDLAVGGPDRHVVAERQVDGIRHADVVGDHVELVGRNHLADVVLDALEVVFGLFDPRSGRRPDMQPQLSRVDGWKEIAADKRIERQRHECERQKHADHEDRMGQRPVERPFIRANEPDETGLEPVADPSSHRPASRSGVSGVAGLLRVPL